MTNKPGKRLPSPDQNPLGKLTWYTLGLILLLLGVTFGLLVNRQPQPETPQVESPVVFSLATGEVARLFACSCGACGEKNLADCGCPTATTTKRLIETNLTKGMSREEVIQVVKQVHGHYVG